MTARPHGYPSAPPLYTLHGCRMRPSGDPRGALAYRCASIYPTHRAVRHALTAAALALLASCAHPVVAPCPVETCAGDGLRFYRPTPYVLVGGDGSWKVTPLPDPSQQYVLRVEGWLGDAAMTPTLADGWNFVSMSANTNNDATLAALAGVATSAKSLMAGALHADSSRPVAPGLYRLDLARQRLVGPLAVVAP